MLVAILEYPGDETTTTTTATKATTTNNKRITPKKKRTHAYIYACITMLQQASDMNFALFIMTVQCEIHFFKCDKTRTLYTRTHTRAFALNVPTFTVYTRLSLCM